MFARLRTLASNLIIYGTGDVAVQATGFLLLYFFTRQLRVEDYGVLSLLLMVEVVFKILFRWGVDASFMRLYYDCHDEQQRRHLASTIFFFLVAVNGALLAAALVAAPWVAPRLFGISGYTLPLSLVLVNTFVGGFFFIPFHVLRMQRKAAQFSALTFARSTGTLVLRIALVLWLHLDVLGFVLADIVMTVIFAGVLARWFSSLIRPCFSRSILREALRFGLPRVPHGVAQQVMGPTTDGFLLRLFLPASNQLRVIGQYNLGATFGLSLKLFLSAFEYAWAPFYFETMKEPDAKATFSRVTTYGVAILVLATAGLSAIAEDLVRLITRPGYFQAARVIPWLAVGVTLQGVYLLTSIGLNITKRTEYYPVATGLSAALNVGCNLVLIPRYGILGPAYANVISYAALAATAMVFSQRCYPISYEWSRLARVTLAGVGAYLLATWPLPTVMYSLTGVLVRGTIVLVAFPTLLAVTGFFRNRELVRLRKMARAIVSAKRKKKDRAPEEPV